jgi:hypothetical protein
MVNAQLEYQIIIFIRVFLIKQNYHHLSFFLILKYILIITFSFLLNKYFFYLF